MGKSPGVTASTKRPSPATTTPINNKNKDASTKIDNNNTEIPVRQPAAASHETRQHNNTQSTYQIPGPGFEHQVTNLPGGGLSYSTINGHNPISVQQPQLHQTPGFVPQAQTQLPPGFLPGPTQATPYLAPVSQAPVMAYQNSFMPNTGQHFQPQVPDTTYGPIEHTYNPRFDNPNAPQPQLANASVGQYVMYDGRLYQVVQSAGVQGAGAGGFGGNPIQCVPVQQPVAGYATAPIQVAGQANQQPIFIQGQAAAPGGYQPAQYVNQTPIMNQPAGMPAMVVGSGAPGGVPFGGAPDVMGIGKTGTEIQLEQYHTAQNTKALEPQDIAPADTDPSRMYYCRELDGEWTLRNRFGIDHLGDCRWYVMPGGVFYAVRLAD